MFAILLFAFSAFAQNATMISDATTTISGYIGASGLVGSILDADACRTTAVVTCTAGERACSGIYDIPITFTQGPGLFQFEYTDRAFNAYISVTDNCIFQGSPITAVCEVTALTSSAGRSRSAVTTTTERNVTFDEVVITAGADKLVSGTCTSTPTTSIPENTDVPAQTASHTGTASANDGYRNSVPWMALGFAIGVSALL